MTDKKITKVSSAGFIIQLIAGGGLAIVLALAGYLGYQKYYVQDTAMTAGQTSAEMVPDTAVVPGDTNGQTSVGQPKPDIITADTAPSFDLVRIDNEGAGVIAGTAKPGAEVTIHLDGAKIGGAVADANGKFVAMLLVPTSRNAQVLTLKTVQTNGDVMASNDSVILTPAAGGATGPIVEGATGVDAASVDDAVAEKPQEVDVAMADTKATLPAGSAATVGTDEIQTAGAVTGTGAVVSDEKLPATMADTDGIQPIEPAVKTSKAPGILLANQDGVQVLQPAASGPQVTTNVVIDAISYDALGEVQLSGRGTDAEYVRVYLNNKPILSTRVQKDGAWRTALPNIDTGIYTLRVDQVDADGTVTSRAETPFKRETPEVLQSAQQSTQTQVQAITVQPGSTLWAIARENYGDGLMYVRVFEANRENIRDPDLIYPGQVFTVPQ